ncbi:unnamed protein product, partial [Mesorhabditis belari]|uniref:Uncharacterized protein n=1 Tax=Mesorhabditis belari TaxID=2138241 RepID=A0AAF3ERP9_9BILA
MNPILLKTINYFSDSLLTICFQIVLAYSVERIIAIKYVENYENRWTKRPTLGILLLIGSISSEQGLIMLWYFGLNNTLAYSLQYLFFITAAIFFIVLNIICKRAYATVANRKESTINERFQTARNLKAAHLLLHLAPFKCAANFVSLYVYHWIFEEQSPTYFPLYSTYYFWLNQLQLMIQMVLTVVGQDCLKEELYLMIGRRHRVDAQGITTILGKPMVFTAEQTNQVYFEQIQQSWDIVLNNNQTTGKAKYKEPT